MKRGLVVGATALALTLGSAAQAAAQNTTTFGADAGTTAKTLRNLYKALESDLLC